MLCADKNFRKRKLIMRKIKKFGNQQKNTDSKFQKFKIKYKFSMEMLTRFLMYKKFSLFSLNSKRWAFYYIITKIKNINY